MLSDYNLLLQETQELLCFLSDSSIVKKFKSFKVFECHYHQCKIFEFYMIECNKFELCKNMEIKGGKSNKQVDLLPVKK